MIYIVVFIVTLFACTIGKICGMGGGVIIKPVLDSIGIYSVETINFYSACTVASMSGFSMVKSIKANEHHLKLQTSTPLAIGAAMGGILGKKLFEEIVRIFDNGNSAGGVQALVLFALTLLSFLYTIRKDSLTSLRMNTPLICVALGVILGALGSFLGIGGGPFNMIALYLFFSMSTKEAAENSIYIILISQVTGIIKNIISGSIPSFSYVILIGMIICGIVGSELGSCVNKKITEKTATILFEAIMVLVMALCIYNSLKYCI